MVTFSYESQMIWVWPKIGHCLVICFAIKMAREGVYTQIHSSLVKSPRLMNNLMHNVPHIMWIHLV